MSSKGKRKAKLNRKLTKHAKAMTISRSQSMKAKKLGMSKNQTENLNVRSKLPLGVHIKCDVCGTLDSASVKMNREFMCRKCSELSIDKRNELKGKVEL